MVGPKPSLYEGRKKKGKPGYAVDPERGKGTE